MFIHPVLIAGLWLEALIHQLLQKQTHQERLPRTPMLLKITLVWVIGLEMANAKMHCAVV